MYKIKFIDLNNKEFITNGVPFEFMILHDSLARGNKTYNRYRGWSETFTDDIADQQITEQLTPDQYKSMQNEHDMVQINHGFVNPENNPVISTKYYLFGHLIREEIKAQGTGFWQVKTATFEIIDNENNNIYSYNQSNIFYYDHGNSDYKIIAELSGMAQNRRNWLESSQKRGKTPAPDYLSMETPAPKIGEYLPIIRSCFEDSKKGGYIVRNLGKFSISQENKAGYYKVDKELDQVKFISLVEGFKII